MRRTTTLLAVSGVLAADLLTPASAAATTDTDAPRITVTVNPQTPPPGPSGWYRDLSPFGTLPYVVDFVDPSGLEGVACSGLLEFDIGPPTILGTTYGHSAGVAVDGVHVLDCTGTDDVGNSGVGPGSSPMPTVFKIDRAPPAIECSARARFRRHPHAGVLFARVTDATSGPARSVVAVQVDRLRTGTFTVPVTAFDVAGNSTTSSCTTRCATRDVAAATGADGTRRRARSKRAAQAEARADRRVTASAIARQPNMATKKKPVATTVKTDTAGIPRKIQRSAPPIRTAPGMVIARRSHMRAGLA